MKRLTLCLLSLPFLTTLAHANLDDEKKSIGIELSINEMDPGEKVLLDYVIHVENESPIFKSILIDNEERVILPHFPELGAYQLEITSIKVPTSPDRLNVEGIREDCSITKKSNEWSYTVILNVDIVNTPEETQVACHRYTVPFIPSYEEP